MAYVCDSGSHLGACQFVIACTRKRTICLLHISPQVRFSLAHMHPTQECHVAQNNSPHSTLVGVMFCEAIKGMVPGEIYTESSTAKRLPITGRIMAVCGLTATSVKLSSYRGCVKTDTSKRDPDHTSAQHASTARSTSQTSQNSVCYSVGLIPKVLYCDVDTQSDR
jgi:hypothetical protein